MSRSLPHLLLIVDDWELLDRYEERFRPEFRVNCAPLGPEGIRMAQSDPPDLILLNLTFENMTLSEACAQLRGDARTSGIPVGAVGDPRDGIGPDFWVSAPVSLADLGVAYRLVIEGRVKA